MISRRLAFLTRWPAMAGLTIAGTLAVSMSVTSPASAATSAQAVAAQSAASQGSSPGASHGTACSKTSTGRLTHCEEPVPASKLPAPAKNQAVLSQTPTDIASMVDTRTWTSGGGNTFPGAEWPFGMTQWSPDTSPNRNDGGGYNFGDTSLIGYSLTHISGPGCGAAQDVPILPMTGSLPAGNPNNALTSFTNTGEIAQAGYYSAQSNMPNTITSEFAATPHTSMGRFTFPSTTAADFLIKLQDSQNGDFGDSAQVVGNNEVTGTDTSGNFCGETNNDGQVQQYTVHFDIVFSQPFTASQIVGSATNPRAVFLTFDTTASAVIDAKVGISYVSTANAQLDLQTENPGWNFDNVRAAAQSEWNALLGKIQVSGGTVAQTQEFYSLLYKDLIQPNISSDVNGQYMGADDKVATISGQQQNQYGTYSGWDIYHTLSQLQAILDPSAASDQAQSLVNYYSQDHLLQQWGYLNLNNYVMVGDPAQSIIADYYAFGARSFNTSEALTDMIKQATTVNDVRPGEAMEANDGYIPYPGPAGCCNPHGSVATLLEYDTEDLALSQFASALGDSKDATMLEARANNWENLFDPANGLLNPRDARGNFIAGVLPTFADPGEMYYVEGDAYEYLWNTPNDYSALFSLLGGNSSVAPEINQYLSQPNGGGMNALLSNEFDFGEQYMPDYDGDPAGAQLAVNTMLNTMQAPGPSGLPNNDDLGANSSTTIWEMLGMFPENSGTDTMVFSGPHFPHASISLDNGNTITINAPAQSASNFYVQNLKLNGSPYEKLSVPFSTLSQGATLDWTMGSTPSDWGDAPQDAPPSYSAGLRPVVGSTSSQQVNVAPGTSTTVQVQASNATTVNQAVTASVSVPAGSGLTVTPGGGTFHVPPSGKGSLTLTVSANASAAQTFSAVPVTLTDGTTTLPTVNLQVLVATPGSLLTAFNNAGISDDSDVSAANFGNDGNSYSAEALAGAGLIPGQPVTVGGVQFTWPLPSPGLPDNAVASGQQISINAPAGTQQLGFLGSASNGPAQGLTTLHYSDGSTAQFWLGLSDWTLNGGSAQLSYGNVVAASTAYRNCSGCSSGQDTVSTDVFYSALPVDPAKKLTSVTLPNGATRGELHIFAIGTSTQAPSGPVAALVSPDSFKAGQQVTITGSGFGASQGNSFVDLTDNGVDFGAPNALGTTKAGTLGWDGPFNDGCGTNSGGLTSVSSGNGEQWTASCVTNQTWVQTTPSGLLPGQSYTASVTLEANSTQQTAPVFLDFYNGCVDTTSGDVTLTPGTPVTLTDTTTIGCSNAPQFQIRTDGPGSVDLTATNTSIGGANTIKVDSWSDTSITFDAPAFPANILTVSPGSEAMVTVHVVDSAGTDTRSDTAGAQLLLGTPQTGRLGWGGPLNDGCATNSGGLTSVNSGNGEQWIASCVSNQTWIQVTPTGLDTGQTYTASVTLEANSTGQTAPVFLDFYNGCVDTTSGDVTLTPGTLVTLTDTTTIGCSNTPQFQIRTDGSGSIDLTATNATITAGS